MLVSSLMCQKHYKGTVNNVDVHIICILKIKLFLPNDFEACIYLFIISSLINEID